MSKKYRVSFAKERKEYKEIKEYNKTLNFDSIQSYINSKELNTKFIQDPREHFGHIFTNWYDFLQVDTSNFIQDKNHWVEFCKEKNVKSLDDYYNLCNIYNFLPKEPGEFYKGFTNFHFELDWHEEYIEY